MAEFEGDQDIPSELLDLYRGTLNPHPTGNVVKTRYPYRMPPMQKEGRGVSAKQNAQRERFKIIKGKFATLSPDERARWYDNMPPWKSFLWYYNYFIMSGLVGNANPEQGGFGVIKSIQFVKENVGVGGGQSFTINEVDPAKTVVMMFGNSYISDKIHHYDGITHDDTETQINLSPNIDPAIAEVRLNGHGGYMDISEGTGVGRWGDFFVTDVQASYIKIRLQQLWSSETFGYSLDIIEHKAQTVFPVIDSIAAEAVVISWASTPSVAADVSLIVIEYI